MPRINFTVNQQQYRNIVEVFYNSIHQTGEKIIIYYNPAEFKHKNQSYMGYAAIGFGLIYIVLYFFIRNSESLMTFIKK